LERIIIHCSGSLHKLRISQATAWPMVKLIPFKGQSFCRKTRLQSHPGRLELRLTSQLAALHGLETCQLFS